MKANHNRGGSRQLYAQVVFQYVKDTIWKQITTSVLTPFITSKLFFNTSKIQFESKSQQAMQSNGIIKSCFSIRQRYNLKANHNRVAALCSAVLLFFNTSKIQFESKSQHFASHSVTLSGCFSIRQRYNLKANHNYSSGSCAFRIVVFQYVKDTIWKQITTGRRRSLSFYLLFFNTSKIQFESKSQHAGGVTHNSWCCFSIRQRYNLKANHNYSESITARQFVVFQYVKDTIWKQITTAMLSPAQV